MMKMKYSALLLATSLLAAPAWVTAVEQDSNQPETRYGQKADEHKGHSKMGHYGSYHKMMDPVYFEQHIKQHLETLATPELKAQFIVAQQARLAAAEQQMLLRKLMAEHKAEQIADQELKAATLEKAAADYKLKQLRIKQMQDQLTAAKQ